MQAHPYLPLLPFPPLADVLATLPFSQELPFDLTEERRAVLDQVWLAATEQLSAEDLLQRYLDALGAREPPAQNAFLVSYCIILAPPSDLSWLERAALLVAAALDFRRGVEECTLPAEFRLDLPNPLSLTPFGNFYSLCAVPGADGESDVQWQRLPSAHIIVLFRGRAYSVEVTRQGQKASASSILRVLQQLVGQGEPEEPGFGWLTTLPLAEWSATVRRVAASTDGDQPLRRLQSALFVVALDSEERLAPADCGARLHHGDPGNRWYDTAVQIVVNAAGQAGIVGNFRAGLPGQPAASHASYLWRQSLACRGELQLEPSHLEVTPCDLPLTAADKNRLQDRRTEILTRRLPHDRILEIDVSQQDFRARSQSWGCAIQVAIQRACRHLWGDDFFQAFFVSVLHFRYGNLFLVPARLCAIRSLTEVLDRGEADVVIASGLAQATADYRRVVKAAKSGLEVHTMVGLLAELMEDEELQAVFPYLPRPRHLVLASNLPDLPGVKAVGRFGLPWIDPDALTLHYRAIGRLTQVVILPGAEVAESCDQWLETMAETLRALRKAILAVGGNP